MAGPTSLFDTVFNITRYMPHGYCLFWQPELVWMHVIADLAIALAYYSIPFTILYLLHKRKQSIPYKWVFLMFAIFIFLCGTTHIISIITLWYPIYFFEGLVKAMTAAASLATALFIFPLVPVLLERFLQGPAEDKGSDSA